MAAAALGGEERGASRIFSFLGTDEGAGTLVGKDGHAARSPTARHEAHFF